MTLNFMAFCQLRKARKWQKISPAHRDQGMLITIVVPKLEINDEHGFVDISPYSELVEEEEVLFNVRSRFHVLDANYYSLKGHSIRHLYLLYGPQPLRKYNSLQSSRNDLNLDKVKTECYLCHTLVTNIFAVNLNEGDRALCWKCYNSSNYEEEAPWAIVSGLEEREDSNAGPFIVPKPNYFSFDKKIEEQLLSEMCKRCKKPQKSIFICVLCKMKVCKICVADLSEWDHSVSNVLDDLLFGNNPSCSIKPNLFFSNTNNFQIWNQKLTEQEMNAEDLKRQINNQLSQGQIFLKIQDFQSAEKWFRTKLEYLKNNQDTPVNEKTRKLEMASCLSNLGAIYSQFDRYEEVLTSLLEAWDIHKIYSEDKDPKKIEVHHDLGRAFRNLGMWEDALPHVLEVLSIRKSLFGDNHNNVALSYHELGLLHLGMMQYEEAERYLRLASDILEKNYGKKNDEIGRVYRSLGLLYYSLHKLEIAFEFLQKSLKIFEYNYGENHLDIAKVCSDLAIVSINTRQGEDPENYELRALKIKELIYKQINTEILKSYENLTLICQATKTIKPYLGYLEKTAYIRTLLYGMKDLKAANLWAQLSKEYRHELEKNLGVFALQNALDIKKEIDGDQSLDVAFLTLSIAQRTLTKQPEKSLEYSLTSYNIYKSISGENNTFTAAASALIAKAYSAMHQHLEACKYFLISLKIHESQEEKNITIIELSQIDLGWSYTKINDHENALLCGIEVLKISKEKSSIIQAYLLCGSACCSLGQYNEALVYLLEGQLKIDPGVTILHIPFETQLGIVYKGLGDYYESLRHHLNSLNILVKEYKMYEVFDDLYKTGYYKLESVDLKIAKSFDIDNRLRESLYLVGTSYYGLGLPENAILYLKDALEYAQPEKEADIQKSAEIKVALEKALSWDSATNQDNK